MKKRIRIMLAAVITAVSVGACGQAESIEETGNMQETENTIGSRDMQAIESDQEIENGQQQEEAEISGSLIRDTAYGQVQGTGKEDVQVFYGVPYGAEPVGELRWQAPVDPEYWTEIKDCSEPEEVAMQLVTVYDESGNISLELAGTTDCLNMDIYTKDGAENLPVFVYLHGGNNQTGSSFDFDGSDMVIRDDCVVVSLNHRLSLLGFNCLPALQTEEEDTGNYALLDIEKALRWIRDNIDSFGGDPQNVTVTGFSAGGRNVMALLVSPIFDGLFDKAIAFSGGMTIADEEASAKKIAKMIAPLTVEDGKFDDEAVAAEWLLGSDIEVKEYLYSISDERLTEVAVGANIRMSGFPHLFGDDVTLPASGFVGADYCNDVPIILLTGTSEFSLFCSWDAYLFTLGDDMAKAIQYANKYGNDFYRIFNTQLSAQIMDADYDSDIYVCQINYGGDSSLNQIDSLGSFHGIFVPMLTSNHSYGYYYDFENAKGYQAMSEQFNQYLRNFITAGNPNGDGAEIDWKPWTVEEKMSLVFDADEDAGEADVKLQNVYKTNAEIIAEMDMDMDFPEELKAGVNANVLNGRWFSADLDDHYGNADLWEN